MNLEINNRHRIKQGVMTLSMSVATIIITLSIALSLVLCTVPAALAESQPLDAITNANYLKIKQSQNFGTEFFMNNKIPLTMINDNSGDKLSPVILFAVSKVINNLALNNNMLHLISFSDDTLFPQTFESNPSGNDITLSGGATSLPARPITLAVNKIASNNTLMLSLHSLNDKYMLTGNLKVPAKTTANSTADNSEFSPIKGDIVMNKNTHYSVTGSLTETKMKQITLTINDIKNPDNFKATITFSPPSLQGGPSTGL